MTCYYIFAGFYLQLECVCHCYLREKSQYPVGVEPKTSGLRGLVLFLQTFLLDCTGWGQTWDLFYFVFSLNRSALDHLATAPSPKPTFKKSLMLDSSSLLLPSYHPLFRSPLLTFLGQEMESSNFLLPSEQKSHFFKSKWTLSL